MYDPLRQYRCTIIRGKSQNEMDDLLPLYAKIIDNVCPCAESDFSSAFNDSLKAALSGSVKKKTLDNHRTEIAGKLFGMYYTGSDDTVYSSERTKKFLADSDTPAFFKDLCYKMQFPNGSQKYQTVKEHIDHSLSLRQFPFVIKTLLLARGNNITLTKKDIGYYILNSLDVLQGKSSPLEVVDVITANRKDRISHELTPGSYDNQHITEQINLLELANLIVVENSEVTLNMREESTINLFAEKYADKPMFDVYKFNLESATTRKEFFQDWCFYFSKLSDLSEKFITTAEALGASEESSGEGETSTNTIEIGDEGEEYVLEYEKERVKAFDNRLVGKVIHFGKTRGLGYDIQSVVAKPGDESEFVKYIEVKATKRVTAPNMNDPNWVDTINITRNEWVAARQHRESYSIFRVYFVRNAVIMFVLKDLARKFDEGIIKPIPTAYRFDFSCSAVDEAIHPIGGIAVNA